MSLSGFARVPRAASFLRTARIQFCWRRTRSKSPPASVLRCRTYCRASSPPIVWQPAFTVPILSLTVFGTQIRTPPRASVICLKPVKSMTTTWSIRTPVRASMVCTMSVGPPKLNAALTLFLPWPGISTQLSRGIEVTEAVFRSAVRCRTMIASVRWAPAFQSAGLPAETRLSEPSRRMFAASPATGSTVARALFGMAWNGSPKRSMFLSSDFCHSLDGRP